MVQDMVQQYFVPTVAINEYIVQYKYRDVNNIIQQQLHIKNIMYIFKIKPGF